MWYAILMGSIAFVLVTFLVLLVPFVLLCAMEKTKWVQVGSWGVEAGKTIFWLALSIGGLMGFLVFFQSL